MAGSKDAYSIHVYETYCKQNNHVTPFAIQPFAILTNHSTVVIRNTVPW